MWVEMSEWISVKNRLPPCEFELHETGENVSNVVLIHNKNSYEFNIGMGHVSDSGAWTIYDGEYDFMNISDVTHWMPLPELPE